MKQRMFVLIVSIALFGASALIACEKCITKGQLDPNGGGPYASSICWTADSGAWSYCVGGDSNCTGDDPENVCPTSSGNEQCTEPNLCILYPDSIRLPTPAVKECRVDISGKCSVVGRGRVSFLR